MAIEARSDRDTVFIQTGLRLDSSNAQDFVDQLEIVTGSDCHAVVVDMATLNYISSAGLRAIMQGVRRMQQQGGSLALCSLSTSVRQVFETSGFDQLIRIHPSPGDAAADLYADG